MMMMMMIVTKKRGLVFFDKQLSLIKMNTFKQSRKEKTYERDGLAIKLNAIQLKVRKLKRCQIREGPCVHYLL